MLVCMLVHALQCAWAIACLAFDACIDLRPRLPRFYWTYWTHTRRDSTLLSPWLVGVLLLLLVYVVRLTNVSTSALLMAHVSRNV
jgi:hypothetical protein